ncbi:hypothetical protein GF339_09640, partial [candidate division KSB3 bacterium]|nr:hypothetical protein [candidate division KSB3 bacterium]MBD3324835.1 hypothetical protein [candidate division KSB3 bacterium]
MSKLALDSIQKSTEATVSTVEWIVEILRGSNWVKKLILLDILVLVGLNHVVVSTGLAQIGQEDLLTPWQDKYTIIWLAVVGLLFLAAIVVALKTLPRRGETG